MTGADSSRQGLGRRRIDREGSGAGFRRLSNVILPGVVAIVLLSLYSNSRAVSRSLVEASDASDFSLMTAMKEQMEDYQKEISSLQSQFTKFETYLEQVSTETKKLGIDMAARPQQPSTKSRKKRLEI
jgi:hypothetical protein